ncbi:hypothetical protein AB0D12_31650 [Streptomyces sp. NPDC048479]|uniref:hypothetical protein n=1 Tax=Streptomyces sp. NPDC048479 TaxID=3154725 RepID=UPI00341CCDBE
MIDRLPVTMALSAMLATASGMPVGRGRRPTGAEPPYYLLYAMPVTLSGPPLEDENADASLIYQVTSVSGPTTELPDSYGTQDQAEWMGDKARQVFLGRDPGTGLWLYPLSVTGARNTARSLDIEAGAMNDPADAIISYVQRFRFDLTPA